MAELPLERLKDTQVAAEVVQQMFEGWSFYYRECKDGGVQVSAQRGVVRTLIFERATFAKAAARCLEDVAYVQKKG